MAEMRFADGIRVVSMDAKGAVSFVVNGLGCRRMEHERRGNSDKSSRRMVLGLLETSAWQLPSCRCGGR
jgi:hypothetical protein